MEIKLTKKELIKEMMSQSQAEHKHKEKKMVIESDVVNNGCDDNSDLKEARARIYGTSQADEMKRFYRLLNKLNS